MGRSQVLTAEQRQEVIQTVDWRLRELGVTGLREVLREQTEQLGQAIARLAEAQARTDASLQKLAQAQARTEARVEELAQAQARTEARIDRVEAALERLAEAQARTEARVEELAQAQARTEARIDRVETALERLAQAQARTEAAVQELAKAQKQTDAAVSALGEVIGFGLEDIAKTVLPGYLQRHFGLNLEGPLGEELTRRFFEVDGQLVEINLYGTGRRNGQRAVVLGESKSRIGGSEVYKFAKELTQVEPLVEGEIWRVMFGYYIHPSALEPAAEHQVLLVASYQR